MITDVYYDEHTKKVVIESYRAVAIKPYPNSKEGAFPLHPEDCMYKGKASCYTQSMDSVCGGFMGHAGLAVIRCQEPAESEHVK